MSYEIIYGKQFVKLRKTGEVIPMLLTGSNNCYEARGRGNGRRSRDWTGITYYNHKGKLSEKPDAILSKLDAELRHIIRRHKEDREDKLYEQATPADIRARFGYYASVAVGGAHTTGTSWDTWRGVFSNGIKKALTVEELDKLGVNLYMYSYSYEDSPIGKPAEVAIKTERDYFSELKKWREWQAQSGKSLSLGFYPHDTDAVLRRLRSSKQRVPRVKTLVEQDHSFILTDGSYGLIKYTSRGYKYSYSKSGGKRFRTEQEADNYRKKLLEKGRHKADIWQVERVEGKYTF